MLKTILLSCFVLATVGVFAEETLCGANEQVCNISLDDGRNRFRQCFNIHDQVCVDNLVCPMEHNQRCGDSCYSNNLSYCHHIHDKLSILCPINTPHLCQESCYSEEFYECKDYELIPLKDAHERLAAELDESNFREIDAESDANAGRAAGIPATVPYGIPAHEVTARN